MTRSRTTHIQLVCRGNICRSPMALAITRQFLHDAQLATRIALSSAGIGAVQSGNRPDPRAIDALLRHGYHAPRMRTRAVTLQDFERFDQILAMDRSNLEDLQSLCPSACQHKLRLFLQGAAELSDQEIPDPYYGGMAGFERVLQLCEDGARALVARWRLASPRAPGK